MRDDDYSISPNSRLTFLSDKIELDTIIAGQATNTYSFLVYNRNKQGIRLSRVYLEKGGQSSFYVNVDGSSLHSTDISGLEIGAEDSMRVFVLANALDTDQDAVQQITDRLVFVTEAGLEQSVLLEAFSQSVYQMKGEIIANDRTLLATRPYQIYDSLVIASGVTLTLDPGTQFYFHPSARLIVHGRLVAQGTKDKPVIFRGDRLGNMFAGQPYDRIPAQWGGIVFTQDSYNNILDFCDIHSGEFGIQVDSSSTMIETLRLENSIVHNMTTHCLALTMSKVFVGNSQITNAGGNCVNMLGGDNTFVHTTIANFYPFSINRGVALRYSNILGNTPYPLIAATFLNSIITGYSRDEIRGNASSDKNIPFNYLYQNCLLNTEEANDSSHIINCFWDTHVTSARENNFSPSFDLRQLRFYFTLSEQSKAINIADLSIASQYYPIDRKGTSRVAQGTPDIGCYELE